MYYNVLYCTVVQVKHEMADLLVRNIFNKTSLQICSKEIHALRISYLCYFLTMYFVENIENGLFHG